MNSGAVRDLGTKIDALKKIPLGASIPMEVVAMLMIYLSDNMATNVFLNDFIPKELFNSTMKELGYGSTKLTAEKLNKDFFFQSTEDIGYSTPEELGRILSDIILYKTLEKKYSEKLLEYMSMSYLAYRLTRRLPHHTRQGEKAVIERYGSKAGTFTRLKVVNDLAFAVAKDGQQIVISCMMNGLSNEDNILPSVVDSMQNNLLGDIGVLSFEFLQKK